MGKNSWFKHDLDARNDPALRAIRRKWRYEGYGWYFAILEIIYRDCAPLQLSLDWRREDLYEELGLVTPKQRERFDAYLEDCFDVGLFDRGFMERNGDLVSNRIAAEIERVRGLREKRSRAGEKSGEARRRQDAHVERDGQDDTNTC